MECAPRITMPASVSFTTPGCRNGSGCLWAGVRAVDLGRHDRVGDVQILVARPLVEAHDVVAELPAPAVEELAPAGEAGEHRGHVVGRAPHQPVGALGPEPVDGPPAPEVLRRAGDEPHRADSLAAVRIDARGDVGRCGGGVVPLGDAPDRLGEGGMPGHVVDALAVEEDGAPVAEAREIVGGPAHGANRYFLTSTAPFMLGCSAQL